MPLNTTETELRAAAADDLAEKLKLERRQVIELRELFRNMSADMEAFVAETGNAPNAAIYNDDLRGLLSAQGRRVSTAFSGQVINFLDEAPDDETIIEELAIIAAVSGLTVTALIDRMRNDIRRQNQVFIAEQVVIDTALITATNQREMDGAVVGARAAIVEDGRVPTNAEVAQTSSKDFNNRRFARSDVIAATYTQKIAEGVKAIERDIFFNTRNGMPAVVANVPQIEEIERWVTIGDEVVRPAHIAVDFTVREEGGWVVGGEFMRRPGDPNASMANIANCRCAVVLQIGESVVDIRRF